MGKLDHGGRSRRIIVCSRHHYPVDDAEVIEVRGDE